MRHSYVIVTDRGGHLHDALRLVHQVGAPPTAIVTTFGPDVDYLKNATKNTTQEIYTLPMAFSWLGKRRLFNPILFLVQVFRCIHYARKIRPEYVISTGATAVVVFCYVARCFGAQIVHIENLAQVENPSVTGRLLYPICSHFFVQWPDLLKAFGPKATYAGNIV